MEVYAILIFAIIPGCIIGFFIGFFWFFRKSNIGGRLLLSIVTALVVGYLSPWIIAIPFKIKSEIEQSKEKSVAIDEVMYFKGAISGKNNENDIKAHYASHPLSSLGAWKISSDKNAPGSLAAPGSVVDPKIIPIFIELFKKYPLLVGALANRPETPLDIKLKVADHPDALAVRDMAFNINTPPTVLIRLSTYQDKQMANYACKNKNAPEEAKRICEIRDSLNQNAFHGLEIHVDFPNMFESKTEELSLWKLLVEDRREYVRMWVAQSEYTPSEILSNLSNDKSDSILHFVFIHKKSSPQIRRKIANHYKTDINTLIFNLCKSSNDKLREAVAISPISNHDVLKQLSLDSNYNVRGAVATNPNTTSDILESLAKSESGNDYYSDVLPLIARHRSTPITVLENFYNQTKNKKLSELANRAIRDRGLIPPS
mgnify:CR=1 FL=1